MDWGCAACLHIACAGAGWRQAGIIAAGVQGGVSRRANLVSAWVLAVLVMALFARLGVWQLDRMHEKQAMLDATARVLHDRNAVPLARAASVQGSSGYDWSAGDGRFPDLPAILLDNQQHDGHPGVRAYRVFQPASSTMPLLVDMGWLPLAGNRRMPVIARPRGEQRIQGLLVPPPSAGIVAARAVPQAGGSVLASALDPTLLRDALQLPALAPRVLKLDPASPLGYARDLDVLPNTLPPERHLGYAVQWFGLSLAVLVTALVLTFRKPKSRKKHP